MRGSKPSSRPSRETLREARPSPSSGQLAQRALELDNAELPVVRLRSVRRHPLIYRKLVGAVDDKARPGDLVAVLTPQGEHYGYGLFNPRAEIVVRMLCHASTPPGIEFWQHRLEQAVTLRADFLKLDTVTDAYRVVHAEGDGLSGFVVDRYGDVLSAEVFSLAMYQRSQALLAQLQEKLGTKHTLIQLAPQTHGQEGFLAEPLRSSELPREAAIQEFGTRFRVHFEQGHKTGFFCDQRDNRKRLAELCPGRTVLDLCCYTGGFAVQAARLGQPREVTGVDLDERAIELARENARFNKAKVNFVHADVFGYMRDMLRNGRQFDVVVLDPPKLIHNRRDLDEGTRKHFDLNRLAMQMVAPGGLLLTCSCSGLLHEDAFMKLIHDAARQAVGPIVSGVDERALSGRTVQLLARTGAAPDHPVAIECPETEYLKAVWLRLT